MHLQALRYRRWKREQAAAREEAAWDQADRALMSAFSGGSSAGELNGWLSVGEVAAGQDVNDILDGMAGGGAGSTRVPGAQVWPLPPRTQRLTL
jgi:hypothetical protein